MTRLIVISLVAALLPGATLAQRSGVPPLLTPAPQITVPPPPVAPPPVPSANPNPPPLSPNYGVPRGVTAPVYGGSVSSVYRSEYRKPKKKKKPRRHHESTAPIFQLI